VDAGEAVHGQNVMDVRCSQGAGTAFRFREDFAALRILGQAGAESELCAGGYERGVMRYGTSNSGYSGWFGTSMQ